MALFSISSNFPLNESYASQNVTGNIVYFSVLFVNVKGLLSLVLPLSKTTVFKELLIIVYGLSKTSAAYRILEGVLVSIIGDSLSLVYIKLYINNF